MRSLKQFFSKGLAQGLSLFTLSKKRKTRRTKIKRNKKRSTRRRFMRGG